MFNVYVISKNVTSLPDSESWPKEHLLNLIYLPSDDNVSQHFVVQKPDAIITCGNQSCSQLQSLSQQFARKWLHFETVENITVEKIKHCIFAFLRSTEAKKPVFSVFTASYESGERIERAYRSLQQQTNPHWEWVILDDSKSENTWNNHLTKLQNMDARVRIYRKQHNDGVIGSVKHDAAMLCRGKYLIELDHDDELRNNALQLIGDAFEQHPEVALLGSDCSEIYENTLHNHSYGEHFGFGFHGYYCEWYNGRWINVARNGPINGWTIRHIVGIYNHVRVMRASVYHELDGHDVFLNVADDYELFLRTFISKYRVGLLPESLYLQYRTYDASNFTLQRNAMIQLLTRVSQRWHEQGIRNKFKDLNLKDDGVRENQFGELEQNITPPRPAYLSATPDVRADIVMDPNPNRVSIIMSTYDRPELCLRAVKSVLKQEFTNWILYIVGDHCPALHALMDHEAVMQDTRIRYWNLVTPGRDGAVPKTYAAKLLATSNYIAYLDDDNEWEPDHLKTLYHSLEIHPAVTFALSSFSCDQYKIIVKEPRLYRVDTSCILHLSKLFTKYGYWKTQKEVGYANDWDIVHRWLKGGEKWVVTEKPTLRYNNNHQHQNMRKIYEAYGDQIPLEQDTKQVHVEKQELLLNKQSHTEALESPLTNQQVQEQQAEKEQQAEEEEEEDQGDEPKITVYRF